MLGLLVLFGTAGAIIVAMGTMTIIYHLRHPPRTSYGTAMARGRAIDPADLGFSATEKVFHLSDGRTSPGWIIEGQDRSPGAPVIIMSHGWGDSRVGSLVWAPLLVPVARAVVLYDLRAHGDSTATRSDLGTTEVDDLLGIVEQIDPALGPLVLFGVSIGGGISIAAAAKNAQRGTGPRIVGVIGEGVYRWGMEPVYGYFRLNQWPTFPFLLLLSGHLNFWICRDRDFERARRAAGLRCPLLLLHGTADPVCRFRSAQEIAAAAPDGQVVAFEGGGHLTLIDYDRPRYAQALAAFRARLRATTESEPVAERSEQPTSNSPHPRPSADRAAISPGPELSP